MTNKTYPVLSRIRHSGTVYAPGTDHNEIELSEKEAKRLQALGCIGEGVEVAEGASSKGDFDLKTALVALIAADNDIKSMNMADIGKLLGENARGVKRDHVNAALAEIEAQTKD